MSNGAAARRLHDRLAAVFGADTMMAFTITDVMEIEASVTGDGEEVPGMTANLLGAVDVMEDGATVITANGTIVAKGEGAWLAVGEVPVHQGASVEVPLAELPALVQEPTG
jgi:hypothetical protein